MPTFLLQNLLGNTLLQYLQALLLFLLILLILLLMKRFIIKRIHERVRQAESASGDMLIGAIRKYLLPLCYYGAFYFAVKLLELPHKLSKIFNILSLAILTALGAFFISSVLSFAIMKCWEKKSKDSDTSPAIKWISLVLKIAVWVVAVILFLENTGAHINSLVAGLGIGGIAIAFAAQALLEDFFSFFSIFFDKPFEIGDFITVGEYSGTVEHIGIKTIRLRSITGEQLVFSNKDITNSRVRNYKRMEKRRVLFTIGVTYGTPLPILKEIPGILRSIIESVPETAFDRAHFSAFADYSQNFEVVYYVLSGDYGKFMDIQQEINYKIREAFDTRGISFALPTQTLYLRRHGSAELPVEDSASQMQQ